MKDDDRGERDTDKNRQNRLNEYNWDEKSRIHMCSSVEERIDESLIGRKCIGEN